MDFISLSSNGKVSLFACRLSFLFVKLSRSSVKLASLGIRRVYLITCPLGLGDGAAIHSPFELSKT